MRRIASFAVVLMALCAASAGAGQPDDAQFRAWLERTVWPAARQSGISRAGFDRALTGIRYDATLPGLPGAAETNHPQQAEFRAPGAYFDAAILGPATAVGRHLAARHAALLRRIERRTGVPGHILLAIWGRESNFGSAELPHDAIQVLATRAHAGQRGGFYGRELLAALKLLDRDLTSRQALRSNAAGAMGQPQFMATSYLRYGRDGDGDGRADIWASEADTLASIAAYLADNGWQKGRDWGFEVRVPASVSCTLEGPDQGRTIRDWQALGIARVSGRPFPAHERDRAGMLLMPAGRHGPAFIVTPNFYALKAYNMSDLYALFVGHLGDRIAHGMGDFAAPWQPVSGLNRPDIQALQRRLSALGYDVGGVDGLAGYKTRRAIGHWQQATGRAVTCFPDASIARAMSG